MHDVVIFAQIPVILSNDSLYQLNRSEYEIENNWYRLHTGNGLRYKYSNSGLLLF